MIIINIEVCPPTNPPQLGPKQTVGPSPEWQDSVGRCCGRGGVVHLHVGAENHTDNRHAAAGQRTVSLWSTNRLRTGKSQLFDGANQL